MITERSDVRSTLDGLAIAGSVLCLVHCLALPLILAWLPALSDWLAWPAGLHVWIVALAAPVSLFALWRHAFCEGRRYPFFLGLAGLVIMTGALALEGQPFEPFVTSAGSFALATAHVCNWRGRRACHE